jgi:hypothetical protein
MNPIKQPVEQSLSQNARDRWLRDRYDAKDWSGLLRGRRACSTTLYHMERTASHWAIREAASNLSSMYGLDRDSA